MISTTSYKIYQNSENIVKFEIPEASYVKIGVYDNNNNLVRTYIYNNLSAGVYEINFTSGNLEKVHTPVCLVPAVTRKAQNRY